MKKIITVLLISMVPVIELRGALPIGYGEGLELWQAAALSVLGNLIPVPFLLFFGLKVLNWLSTYEKFGKPFRWILEKGKRNADKINGKALFWGLMSFVAIPLPGTGAWTGCLVAMVLQIDFKKAFLPIAAGVVISAIIVCGVVLLIESGVDWLKFLVEVEESSGDISAESSASSVASVASAFYSRIAVCL